MSLIINSSEVSKIYSGNKEISKLYDGSGNLLFEEEQKRREWFKLNYPLGANEICTDGEILFVTTNVYQPFYSYDGSNWEIIYLGGNDSTTSNCSHIGDNFYFYESLIDTDRCWKKTGQIFYLNSAKGSYEHGLYNYSLNTSYYQYINDDGIFNGPSEHTNLNEYLQSYEVINKIKYFKNKIWICCTRNSKNNPNPSARIASIYYSHQDGAAWGDCGMHGFIDFFGIEVCGDNVVCYGPQSFISNDGQIWNEYKRNYTINVCNYANGRYFDLSEEGILYCDGIETNVFSSHPNICSISYCKDRYIGEFEDGIYSSEDGLTWNRELDIQRERANTKRPFIFKDKIYVTTEQGVYYTNS